MIDPKRVDKCIELLKEKLAISTKVAELYSKLKNSEIEVLLARDVVISDKEAVDRENEIRETLSSATDDWFERYESQLIQWLEEDRAGLASLEKYVAEHG